MCHRVATLALLVTTCLCASLPAAEGEGKKIVLLATRPDHPYGSHMYEFECRLLAKCLRQTPGVETEVLLDRPEDASRLDGASALVFYTRPGGDIALAAEHREKFQQLMAKGVGYVAIHWGTAATEENRAAYLKILGGWFHRPPCQIKTTTSRLVQVDPEHPICRGWQDYESREEFYLNLFFDERARPLVKANVDGMDQTVAWTFERGDSRQGRSFGTTLGHFHDNFKRPAFRRLLVNGILWAAHAEVPSGGAPVELEPVDLELPPETKVSN
jgi:type 1 glutamine amidotransferase